MSTSGYQVAFRGGLRGFSEVSIFGGVLGYEVALGGLPGSSEVPLFFWGGLGYEVAFRA